MATLSLENIKALIAPLNSVRQPWSAQLKLALDAVQRNFDRLTTALSTLETSSTTTTSSSGQAIVVKRFFLTADLTVPLPDEPNGTVILYLFRQDSTGGWIVTFPPEFTGMYSDAVDTTAQTLSGFIFSKESDDLLVPALTGIAGVI